MPIDDGCSHNSPAADEGHKLDSIKGSNKTVESPSEGLGKRKRTDHDEGDGMYQLDSIKGSNKTVESPSEGLGKRKRTDHDEGDVLISGDAASKITASTFVAAEEGTSAFPETPPPGKKIRGCCSWVIDPNQKFPKTDDVHLDEEEKKIWMDFKELDKDNPGLGVISYRTVHKHEVPLLVGNPIVTLTSKFAVTAFNEAIEMYVKKGELNNIHDLDVVECKYLKVKNTGYYFYIIIEAFEERKRGVYDAKVKLNWDDGSKSLLHFVLTDRKPLVLKEKTKLRTHPASWKDCSGIPHSGMRRRRNRRSICRGYDYRTPWAHGGPSGSGFSWLKK